MPPAVPPRPPEVPAGPRVSIVVVTHNCESALRRSIAALEASTGRERFEILTVDAGSTDGCPRIDAEFPSVTVLRLPRNFGKTRARNIGMRTAQADLILFLDPNVEVRPGAVHALASALESREELTAAGPVLEDPSGAPIQTAFCLPTPSELAEASLGAAPLPRAAAPDGIAEAIDETAFMVRRNFVAGMNYLDEKRFSEHWSLLEVCWQIRNAGKKILVVSTGHAVLHPDAPAPSDETLYAADRVSGAAAYISKHLGFGAGISFRLKCLFSAMVSLRLRLALSILTASRLDPTQ
ncbi:MAG: glycosyltransferase [Candidatus Solibacter usitatus]|nr:glycosyltransferase [Candidatus Solibacter usitatus]